MKDKELLPSMTHYKSFFKLKQSNCDSVKLQNFIHKGQSEMYSIMDKIETLSIKPTNQQTNVVKKFFHRLRGDRIGSIRGLHFDKLFNVNINKINQAKKNNGFQGMFKNKQTFKKKIPELFPNKNKSQVSYSNHNNPIRIFKSNAQQLRKMNSIASSISNSSISIFSSKQPLYITSGEFKADDNIEESKTRKSINSIVNDNTIHSNRILKSSINDIRTRFDESLKNLEYTIIKRSKNDKKPNQSLSITSDQSLFKQRFRRNDMIDNITNVEIPKIEIAQNKKKKFFSADYTQKEVEEIMKDIKLKGFYVTDRYNNKKYLSIDENHNAMTKDYYMNRITESSAFKHVNYVKKNYLTNTKKKYDKEDIRMVGINRTKLYNLDRDLDLRYKKLLNA
jgi:hypothetical protein